MKKKRKGNPLVAVRVPQAVIDSYTEQATKRGLTLAEAVRIHLARPVWAMPRGVRAELKTRRGR